MGLTAPGALLGLRGPLFRSDKLAAMVATPAQPEKWDRTARRFRLWGILLVSFPGHDRQMLF